MSADDRPWPEEVIVGLGSILVLANAHQVLYDNMPGWRAARDIPSFLHKASLFVAVSNTVSAIMILISISGVLPLLASLLNELNAGMVTFGLSVVTVMQVRVTWIALCLKTRPLPRWPIVLFYGLNLCNLLTYLCTVVVMACHDNLTIWKAIPFFFNAFCLVVLLLVLLIAATILVKHVEQMRFEAYLDLTAFKRFVLLTTSVICLAISATVASAIRRITKPDSEFYSQEPESNSSLSSMFLNHCFISGALLVLTV
eukprot:g62052.t1